MACVIKVCVVNLGLVVGNLPLNPIGSVAPRPPWGTLPLNLIGVSTPKSPLVIKISCHIKDLITMRGWQGMGSNSWACWLQKLLLHNLPKISLDEAASTYDMASKRGIVTHCGSYEIEPNVDMMLLIKGNMKSIIYDCNIVYWQLTFKKQWIMNL